MCMFMRRRFGYLLCPDSLVLSLFHECMYVCVVAAAAATAVVVVVVVVVLNSYRAIFINPWRGKQKKGLLIEYIYEKKILYLSCVKLSHIAPLRLPHKQDSS